MWTIHGEFLTVLIIVVASNLYASASIKCLLNRLENCDQNGLDFWKINVTLKTVDGKQYIDGLITLEKPLDNTLWVNVSVEKLINGKFLYIFSFHENKACDSLGKYWGEFLYEMQRMGQLMPRMCPMEKGKYHWHNAPLHLEKVPVLPSLPFGTLLFTNYLYEKNNNLYACVLFEVYIYL